MFHPNTRILVVDDISSMRSAIKMELRSLGFKNKLYEASCVKDALQILRDHHDLFPIQLIISDWNMPETTGLSFLKQIRQMEKYKNVPFLMVTAEADPEQVIEAAKAGVSNYIVKPLNRKTLGEKLKLVWKKHFPEEAAALEAKEKEKEKERESE